MTGTNVYHVLGLHMHQPPGNLRLLIETNPREAEQIIRCYERVPRFALQYAALAHLHVGFSGALLQQFLEPHIIDRYRHIVDIPWMLDRYREADNVEFIGTGYYHPIFPLTPKADWEEQLARGRAIVEDTFGRVPRGFWPPEMAFSMDMIPALVRAGYEYVVVDGVHVRPEDGLNDIYRPYQACRDGVCITVVPRDRGISNVQETGLDPDWFARESHSRTRGSPRPMDPRLVTTWSDGENRDWFRRLDEEGGFFGRFFIPYMERVNAHDFPVVPARLSDYLKEHPPTAHAQVQDGAWNLAPAFGHGYGFSQWAGSEREVKAVELIHQVSRRYWDLHRQEAALKEGGARALARARSLILEAETSCFLFSVDARAPQIYERALSVQRELDHVELALRGTGVGEAVSSEAVHPDPPAHGH